MTIKKLCFLSLLVALLIVTKIALQGVPFLELITLLFIVYGLTLSLKENWFIFITFFLLNIAINGFGLYWIPYIVFFPLTFTFAYVFKNFRHRYLICSFIAINCGFLIFASYFLSDVIIFGYSYAIVSGTNAFWFNFLEGMINAVFVFILGIPLVKLLNYMQKRLFFKKLVRYKYQEKLTTINKILISSFILFFLGGFSIIPIYLYSNLNNHNQSNLSKPMNSFLSVNGDKYFMKENQCLIIFKESEKELINKVENCDSYISLGAYLDTLKKDDWLISFIDSRANDFNIDGKKERFVSSINNPKKNFFTNDMCPRIYINTTPSPVGVDLLQMNNQRVYKFDFKKEYC